MKATEAVKTLQMILQRCTTPLVISRYHATRKLAQEYQGDTLTMLLEVGLRTKEANEVWSALHRMEKSSAWVTAGTYLRREGMQRSALGKRLAMLNWWSSFGLAMGEIIATPTLGLKGSSTPWHSKEVQSNFSVGACCNSLRASCDNRGPHICGATHFGWPWCLDGDDHPDSTMGQSFYSSC